jgi:hypothetical protein
MHPPEAPPRTDDGSAANDSASEGASAVGISSASKLVHHPFDADVRLPDPTLSGQISVK